MSLALLLALMTHARAPVKPVPPLKARFASFPRIDQLHERLPDGHASENAGMNCIPTSIAAGLEFLTGKSFSGDAVKEAVYGADYKGPTQIYRYLDWVQAQGVEMKPVLSRNPEVLVAELRKLLERGVPAVLSVPGDLQHPSPDPVHPKGLTHVVIAAGFDDDGNIRAMNPWGGVWLSGSDAFWAARISYGELWPMQLVSPADTPGVEQAALDAPPLENPALPVVPVAAQPAMESAPDAAGLKPVATPVTASGSQSAQAKTQAR